MPETTAAAQLQRILALIPHVADGEEHAVAEVAARIGVDAATLRGDLVSLVTRYHEPAGFVEAVQMYLEADRVTVQSNHFLRPMRLTRAELCALELGLAMLRNERPPAERAAIERARERIRALVAKLPEEPPPELPYYGSVAHGTGVDAEHLAVVREGVRGRRKLALTYRSGGAERAAERVVWPYAVVAASGMFYVVAHCENADALRIFRLDRVESVAQHDARFTPPAGWALDAVLEQGKAFQAARLERVRVRYSPRVARWIAEREGQPLAADGSLTMEHPVADRDWAVRHVLQYGPEAEVLEPAELRAAVRDRLQRTAAASAPAG